MPPASAADVIRRNNVRELGDPTGRPIVFSHGFGCSQVMWRGVTPAFEATHRVILLDLVGAGDSDAAAYDRAKYDSLDGYVDDIVEILEALETRDAVFVGHSVSSMVGVLASQRARDRIGALVLVGPSPRYVDDADYAGGFSRTDIAGLLDALDANYLGWSTQMGPVIVGNPDRPELAGEWEQSFCRVDPEISRHFARVTFLSDNRADLAGVTVPTLIVQSSEDHISPTVVGDYVHEHIAGSTLVTLPSTGHLANLADPQRLATVIRDFLA